METLGPINVTGQNFLRDLGCKLTTSTGDSRETCFLLQRLSMAEYCVKRGRIPPKSEWLAAMSSVFSSVYRSQKNQTPQCKLSEYNRRP